MKGVLEERAVELGVYILENKATVRAAAKEFDISKINCTYGCTGLERFKAAKSPGLLSKGGVPVPFSGAVRRLFFGPVPHSLSLFPFALGKIVL